MEKSNPATTPADVLLGRLRSQLLELHSALLEYERKRYEENNGKITSTGNFFALVTNHPSFAWLHALSELIVSIDAMTDGKNHLPPVKVKGLFEYTRLLLTPSQHGTAFERKYFESIHADPEIALAHGKIKRLVPAKKQPQKKRP